MYIVKNFDNPDRNIHLSYHDGEHYNSIRLKDDFFEDVPHEISLDLINCVEQTTNADIIKYKDKIVKKDLRIKSEKTYEKSYFLRSNILYILSY